MLRKGKPMTNKEIKRFLDLHPYTNFSAAGIIYELYLLPEFEENGFEYISQYITPSDEDVEKKRKLWRQIMPMHLSIL